MLPPAARWVAVHDAVRPLVTPATIEAVIAAARRFKAALAAGPSRDTVKIADGRGFVRASPDRATLWLAQTPQVFERRLLEKAHRLGKRLKVTDDAQLVERLGIKVRLVDAPPENLKVTRPIDLWTAELILKAGKK
jgi:2-C-methyl-D-erythritol 4-phosphate cytidylyltransferase